MTRHPDPPSAARGRRGFLLGALGLPVVAALQACSGAPQNVPPAPPVRIAPPPEPPAAGPAPQAAGSSELAELREFRLSEGIEPAVVFRAAWGR